MNLYSSLPPSLLLALVCVTTLVTHAETPTLQAMPPQTMTPALVSAAQAAAADPMLNAMEQELLRERELLVLPGLERPYFIEYRLDDFSTWDAIASYGALSREDQNHQRVVRVTVRVGDYTLDSSSSEGDGALVLAPEENNPAALRYALWSATDAAYKAALGAYSAKQAALKRFEKEPTEKDFAAAPPVIHLEPLLALTIDKDDWKHRIIEASGLFRTDPSLNALAPAVQYSNSTVRGVVVNRFLVNSEGSVSRHGYSIYSAQYNVGGQASDGMQLGRSNGPTAPSAATLESAQTFHQRALDDVKSFAALRNAPVVDAEDYHGPVLFSGDASTDVFDSLFIPNIQAMRPAMGTTARTTGDYQSSYHSRVLPTRFNVVDDPRRTTFDGKALVGSYQVDDQGVLAQSVDVVEQGKLVNYLTSRTPVRDFPTSNGHGRAVPGQAAQAAASVTIFTAIDPLSTAAMHAKLLSMAREQKRDVYEVETLSGIAPRMLFLVHLDGTRQLVRGAVFDELDNRSLRSDIIAAGSEEYVQNRFGALPQTTIAPSILFDDIGVKRATEQQQKLPYYAPPTAQQE
jgi:TldD protein